jgi:hypothetical protein
MNWFSNDLIDRIALVGVIPINETDIDDDIDDIGEEQGPIMTAMATALG